MWVIILLTIVIILTLLVRHGTISVNTKSSNDNVNSKARTAAAAQSEYIPDSNDPYWLGERDTRFKTMQAQYYTLCEEIEADYTVLTNAVNPSAAAYDKVEKKCVDATALFQMLVPLWKKYDRGVPDSASSYKRLAMIREKKGDYEGLRLPVFSNFDLGCRAMAQRAVCVADLPAWSKRGTFLKPTQKQ